jgi:hypothetical protein
LASFLEPPVIVLDGNEDLTFDGKSSLSRFPRQGHFLHRLEQSGTEILMRMNHTIYDGMEVAGKMRTLVSRDVRES